MVRVRRGARPIPQRQESNRELEPSRSLDVPDAVLRCSVMAVAQTMEITMFARSLGAAALVVALAGCGDSGPSGARASSAGSSAESAAAGRSAGQVGVGGGGSMAQPT